MDKLNMRVMVNLSGSGDILQKQLRIRRRINPVGLLFLPIFKGVGEPAGAKAAKQLEDDVKMSE
jgi:hypothetical protein